MQHEAVVAALREADPDRHLATLYAPEEMRPALQALYAFDAEVGTLRERVREPMAGEIRLQWWRDALALPPGAMTGSPLADALRGVVVESHLPAAALDRLLEARIFDLYDDPMPDRTTLEGYLGETRSALVQLAMQVLDPVVAKGFADAAGHGGVGLGIAQILRALPGDRRRGQCFFPADLLAAAGTSRDALFRGEVEAGRAVAAMIALGREHMALFRQAARSLPQSLRPAVLPLATVGAVFDKTERLGVAALETPARLSPLRRQWRMFRAAAGRW
ncbi:MAG: phytoene/squalene synthase family protein [Rhizobiaceae bacterium]|nr:phytoene/squalene synthase family protein [Rhizobiaceae bacterium]